MVSCFIKEIIFLKTLLEKGNMLVTIIYSFCHSVFCTISMTDIFFQPSCPYIFILTQLRKKLGKHCGKGEFAQNEQFHLFPQ